MGELLDLTDRIAELERKRRKLGREISRLSDEMRLIAARHTLEIWQATDESGKRIYSNEKVREAELRLRLHSDPEYQELGGRIQEVEDEHNDILMEIGILRERKEALMIESGLLSPRTGGEDRIES